MSSDEVDAFALRTREVAAFELGTREHSGLRAEDSSELKSKHDFEREFLHGFVDYIACNHHR